MKSFHPLRLAQAYFGLNPLIEPHPTSSSILLAGGTIIAFNRSSESLEIVRNGAILLMDDKIYAIYESIPDVILPRNTEILNTEGKIITPGFISTHNHGWLTPFKTIGSNTTLAEYLVRYGEFSPANTLFTPEDVYIGTLHGMLESLNAGVTTILEHASSTFSNETSEAGLHAAIDSGMRILYAFAFHDLGFANYTIADQMNQWKDIARSDTLTGTLVSLAIAYDRFSIAPKEEVEAMIDLALDFNTSAVTTHCIGGPYSLYNSPELVDSFNFLNTTIPIVFSHASYLTATGAALLRSSNQYVSTCPESEVFSGINHPLHENFQDQTALGVDGQSDWSGDIVTQVRLWLGKLREVEYTKVNDDFHVPRNSAISVNQAFLLATRHGGLALRREDLGIIAVGAKADLVVFDGDSPGMLGWLDPVEAVIQHSNVGDVEHVIVNGKFVKRHFKLLVKEYDSIKKRFVRSARRIQKLWKEIPYPVLEGLFVGVSEYATTEIVDTLRGAGDGMGEPNLS